MSGAEVQPSLPTDTLLHCLLVVARLHDRPLTVAAATAGLPLEKQRLTPPCSNVPRGARTSPASW